VEDENKVIKDLEEKAYKFYKNGEYYISYLILFSLLEGSLGDFLKIPPEIEIRFYNLIEKLGNFLETSPYKQPENSVNRTIDNLHQLRKVRNNIVHSLWQYGYKELNQKAKILARKAFLTYILNVEYLGTFNEEFEERWCIEYGVMREIEEWMEK
jgi:hypothetical protein